MARRIRTGIGVRLMALLLAGCVAPAGAQLDLTSDDRLLEAPPRLPESAPQERLIPDDAPARSESQPPSAQHVSRAEAASLARERHGGRVLAVHWTGELYRVKLLRRGEVRIVSVEDAPPHKTQQ